MAASGTPVLRDLRAATPQVNELVDLIPKFSTAAQPGLRRLAVAADTGRKTIRAALPVVRLLRTFAAAAGPTGTSLNALLVNLQQRGGIENLLSFAYGGAAAASRYDAVSHILPAHVFTGPCAMYAETPVAGCSANYGSSANARAATAPKAGTTGRASAAGAERGTQAPAASKASPSSPTVAPAAAAAAQDAASAATGALPSAAGGQQQGVAELLKYLLGS